MITIKLINSIIYFLIVLIMIKSTVSDKMFAKNGRRRSTSQLTKLFHNYDKNGQVQSVVKYFYWPSTIKLIKHAKHPTSEQLDPTINRRQMETLATPILITTNGQSSLINPYSNQDSSDGSLSDRWDRNVWFWPLILATALPIVIGAIVLPLAVFFLIELIFILLMMRNQAVQVTPIPNQNVVGQRRQRRSLYVNGQSKIQRNLSNKIKSDYNPNFVQNDLIDFIEQQFIQSLNRFRKSFAC